MLSGPTPDHRPWPAAPRPFHEEAMGSWLGRVAARYRMGVTQLLKDYDLQVPINASGAGWLLLPALNTEVLQRLARLARMKVDMLQAIQIPVSWSCDCRNVFYCKACLFVNPEDVFSPMWKRQWFDLQCQHSPRARMTCITSLSPFSEERGHHA
jgi:hypothetical protein